MIKHRVITCTEDSVRLDRFIRQFLKENISQGTIQKLLRKGLIKVNKKKSEACFRLNVHDQVTLPISIETSTKPSSTTPNYSNDSISKFIQCIIWEDEDICIINKPSGIAVQGGTKTLHHLDGLLICYKQHQNYNHNFKLVHRLDRDTSGVFVVAKNHRSAASLAKQFYNSEVKKVYWAIVHGRLKKHKGMIDLPLIKKKIGNEEKICVSKDGKQSVTHYRVVKYLNQQYTLVECKPLTGRTHQLRVHMSEIHHPIVGDTKYGGIKAKDKLCLHAKSVSFKDVEGNPLTFSSPPPLHMLKILEMFKINWELCV